MSAEPRGRVPAARRSRRAWQLLDNLASGYAYLGFAGLVTLFLVPVYVHALGPTPWGALAWCLTLQGVLFSLDAALGPLLLRDVARAAAADRLQQADTRFLRLYGGIALALFALGQLLLSGATSLPDDVVLALRLALLQFLFQFANNAAVGVWHALQRQRFANLRLAGFALLKHALALALVLYWKATPVAYFIPFAAVSALEFVLNRLRLRREHRQPIPPAAPAAGGEDWRGLAGFAAVAALATAITQIDRIVLARQLSADDYGVYFLLGSVLLALLHLQMPLQRTFLPRLATAAAPRRAARAMLLASALLLALPCLVAALWSEPLLRLWLRDATLAATGAPALQLMLVAVALFALFGPSGTLLLVERRYRALAAIQAATLAAQALVLVLLAPTLGLVAGGLAWLAAGLVQLAGAVLVRRPGAVHADSSRPR